MNNTVKSIVLLLIIALFGGLFALIRFDIISNPFEEKVTKISVSMNKLSLNQGDTFQLLTDTDQEVIFESNNPDIATVDEKTTVSVHQVNAILVQGVRRKTL